MWVNKAFNKEASWVLRTSHGPVTNRINNLSKIRSATIRSAIKIVKDVMYAINKENPGKSMISSDRISFNLTYTDGFLFSLTYTDKQIPMDVFIRIGKVLNNNMYYVIINQYININPYIGRIYIRTNGE